MVKKSLLLVVLFFVLSHILLCDTPSIRIVSVKGDEAEADVKGNGELEIAEVGMVLEQNAKIITGMGTQVVIDFAKRGVVTIKEMTNFSVGEFKVSAEGITATTNMKVGEVNVKVDKRYKEIDFTVSSPTCTASVRGSETTFTSHGPKFNRAVYGSGRISFKNKRTNSEINLTGSTAGSTVSNFNEWDTLNPVHVEEIFNILPPPPDGWTEEEMQQLITTTAPTGNLTPQDTNTMNNNIQGTIQSNVGDGTLSIHGGIPGYYTGFDTTGTIHVSW